ncbi:hypothetical protein Tco_0116331 [Tanacetum coccineum]
MGLELLFSEAEVNSRLNDIHQSDGFSLVLPDDKLLFSEAECNSELNDIHQSDGFSLFEPSAGMLLSGLAKGSGH